MKWNPLVMLLPILLATGALANAQSSAGAQTNAGTPAQRLTEFSIQINDGLGRAVPGVAVEVYRLVKQTNANVENVEKIALGKAVSDNEGLARGLYNKASIPSNETFYVTLSKSGYASLTAVPQVRYILNRQFHSNDVARIAKLSFAQLNEELPELLAGEMDLQKLSLADLIFAHDNELRPGLKRLLDDKYVGRQAAETLAYLGNPDDVRLMLGGNFTPNGNPAVNRWASAVASALLEPTTAQEWSFLKSCAMGDFGDRWVDAAGIRTLRLIASPQSLRMLQEVRNINPARAKEIDAAITYINSRPAPLADKNLATAADKLAQSLGVGAAMGNEAARYNVQRDKALVDCNFVADGTEYLVYTATYHKVGDTWKLRGVREARRTLLPKAPETKKASAAN